ncbi:GMC family oxidoreductase [Ketobacter sp.]|uniref:GMC family oxidoreductase n=1 Tax=Ketobacter sp. TaxID=2083498 RepID=UPI000F1F36AF|nr:GMC family oxidoreductase [Ketobacter sp.]RLT93062.1 MAG: GMC family oxidoreductase [Ketobacter sp.]
MDTDAYDYIVVGGGSAGCIAAARLAQASSHRVLLLEVGDPANINPETLAADGFKDAFANDRVMWDRMSTRQPECGKRSLYVGTGTGMGGSGAVNGMVYTRGDRQDFEQWPPGWQWADVAPAFAEVEALLKPRPRPASAFTDLFIRAAGKLGFKRKDGLNDGDLNGTIGYNDMNYEGAFRRHSYAAFLRNRELPNLTVLTQARCHKILFEDKRAVGVQYERHGRVGIVRAQQEIILCAGALETPKLLMLSGIGPHWQLQQHNIPVVHRLDGIGQNLQDHPNVCLFYRARNTIDFGYPQLYGFHHVSPASHLPDTQPDTCFVLFSAPSALKHSMKRMLPLMLLPGVLYRQRWLRRSIRTLIEWAFLLPPLQHYVERIYGIVVILGKPLSRGSVTLASRNPEDQAQIDPAYYRHPADLQTLVAGVELAKAIAQQSEMVQWGNQGLVRAVNRQHPQQVADWIKGATMTTFHFCGTCAMGEDPDSPVDTQLRVKGVAGLRVADASVMPVIPVSALNAPSMMIGWRVVDFILKPKTSQQQPEQEGAAKKRTARTGPKNKGATNKATTKKGSTPISAEG